APLPSRVRQPTAPTYFQASYPAFDEAQPCALTGQQADIYLYPVAENAPVSRQFPAPTDGNDRVRSATASVPCALPATVHGCEAHRYGYTSAAPLCGVSEYLLQQFALLSVPGEWSAPADTPIADVAGRRAAPAGASPVGVRHPSEPVAPAAAKR